MKQHHRHLFRRFDGYRGDTIPMHRALNSLAFDPARLFSSGALALLSLVVIALALPLLAELWAQIARFWLEVLGVPARVVVVEHARAGAFVLAAPRLDVFAAAPSALQWSVGLAATAAMLLVSILLPARLLPVAYALRLLGFVQISSQVVFAVAPQGFPYEVGGYTEVLFVANVFLLGLVPVVLALTYSPLDFRLRHQAALSLFTLLHLALFVPMQYTAHAWILHNCSLLWMPLLFWAFGLTIDVMIVVALYGWGVSWSSLPYRPGHRRRHGHRRNWEIKALLSVSLAIVATLWPAPSRAESTRSVQAGVDVGEYTDGLGSSDSQFVAFTLDRRAIDRVRLDLGRARRFGDEGFGVGVGYTRVMRPTLELSAGLSTGSGDVIFPDLRFDLGVRRTGLLDGRLLADLGYTHIESKGENSSDGLGAGLFASVIGPWSVGVDGRVDIGQPGSTTGYNGAATVQYGLYRKFYASLRGEIGRVAYTLVGPTDTLAEYDARGARLGLTWYVRDDRGFGLEASVLDTDFYTLRNLGLRAFIEW